MIGVIALGLRHGVIVACIWIRNIANLLGFEVNFNFVVSFQEKGVEREKKSRLVAWQGFFSPLVTRETILHTSDPYNKIYIEAKRATLNHGRYEIH